MLNKSLSSPTRIHNSHDQRWIGMSYGDPNCCCAAKLSKSSILAQGRANIVDEDPDLG
jgi:hypothetical protein